ncbi:hypothetical protein OIU76_021903 [Salix suchowensis]|nr:hypothetical protein OIU76_021903 [Salix suchowensis]
MELPQQSPFGTEGRKPPHDFLSLDSHSSTVQQDPTPPSQGGFLQTHDFLQPLERVSKATAREVEILTIEKPPPPAPPPSVEHILPWRHRDFLFSQWIHTVGRIRLEKWERQGRRMWEKDPILSEIKGTDQLQTASALDCLIPWLLSRMKAAVKTGQWTTSERPSHSSSNNHRNSFSSLSSSQPPGLKSTQSFIEMIQSAKGSTLDDDLDDEETFLLKKETPSPIHKGELRVKIDGKSNDQKPNTPRSKHSATEQRRRSKINDRFQTLRELIPHGDQKRDKASFLLEVIEYVQFLQEKVQKYEGSYQGWNHDLAKLGPWRNNTRPVESSIDQSRGVNSGVSPALLLAAKLDEKNITISSSINPGGARNPDESDTSSAEIAGAAAQFPPRLAFDAENTETEPQPQPQPWHAISCTSDGAVASDKLKQQNLTVEGGTISISSAYSQGLLNTLTQALQSSGVDLSQASVSVQIELGKKGNSRQTAPTSIDNNVPPSNQGTMRSTFSSGEESNPALKKLKTSKR